MVAAGKDRCLSKGPLKFKGRNESRPAYYYLRSDRFNFILAASFLLFSQYLSLQVSFKINIWQFPNLS